MRYLSLWVYYELRLQEEALVQRWLGFWLDHRNLKYILWSIIKTRIRKHRWHNLRILMTTLLHILSQKSRKLGLWRKGKARHKLEWWVLGSSVQKEVLLNLKVHSYFIINILILISNTTSILS